MVEMFFGVCNADACRKVTCSPLHDRVSPRDSVKDRVGIAGASKHVSYKLRINT